MILGKRSKHFFTFDQVVDSGPKMQPPPQPEEEKRGDDQHPKEDEVYLVQPIEKGVGKIITSGKTVHGFDT